MISQIFDQLIAIIRGVDARPLEPRRPPRLPPADAADMMRARVKAKLSEVERPVAAPRLDRKACEASSGAAIAREWPDVAGILLQIDYVDAEGQASSRRVKAFTVLESRGVAYLNGYCHERGAPRRFRVDRIGEVIELGGGEIFASGEDWLRGLEEIERRQWLMERWYRVRDAVTLLNFAARRDGHVHPNEEAVIEEYIRWRMTSGRQSPDDPAQIAATVAHAKRYCPDENEVTTTLMQMAEGQSAKWAKIVVAALDKVIKADGQLDPREREFRNTVVSMLYTKHPKLWSTSGVPDLEMRAIRTSK